MGVAVLAIAVEQIVRLNLVGIDKGLAHLD